MKPHLTCSFAFSLALSVILYSCTSGVLKPDLPPNAVLVGEAETVVLPSGLSVRADSLFDSRCPEGWQCIVAGSVRVRISASKADQSVSVILTDFPLFVAGKGYIRGDSIVTQLGSQPLTVVLRDVVPHRTASNPNPKDKKAIVQISF